MQNATNKPRLRIRSPFPTGHRRIVGTPISELVRAAKKKGRPGDGQRMLKAVCLPELAEWARTTRHTPRHRHSEELPVYSYRRFGLLFDRCTV